KEKSVAFERQCATRVRKNSHRRVRIARVPAGVLRVVVELILRVPSDDDIAKTEPALERRKKFRLRDVLAAQNAVDIDAGDFNVRETALLDDGARIRNTFD